MADDAPTTRPVAGRHAIAPQTVAWTPMLLAGQRLDGVGVSPLVDAPEGWQGYLMRMQPLSRTVMHTHSATEMLVVLAGSVQDSDGQCFEAPHVLVYAKGSSHVLRSPTGCTLLVVESQPSDAVGGGTSEPVA